MAQHWLCWPHSLHHVRMQKKEVAKFAADFATKVSNNQKDSLLAVWPDVVKADSLALAFSPDASLWRRQIEKDSSKCLLAREQIL